MMKETFLRARVAGLLVAVAVLASCYAPLANQKGYLNLGLKLAVAAPTDAIVLVVDSGYQDSLAEMLNLISRGKHIGLTATETDRLKTVGEVLSTNGAVKFGGFPFYGATLGTSSGSFEIPGVPADRSYFVKVFVLNQGVSFGMKDFDEHFFDLVQLQNLAFSPEDQSAWQAWVPAAGQPVAVNAGESAPITVTLSAP